MQRIAVFLLLLCAFIYHIGNEYRKGGILKKKKCGGINQKRDLTLSYTARSRVGDIQDGCKLRGEGRSSSRGKRTRTEHPSLGSIRS